MFRSNVSPANLPEGWHPKQLHDIARIHGGGRLGLTKSDYVDEGTPAYSAAGQDGYVPVVEGEEPSIILSSIGARCGKSFLTEGSWTTLANTQVITPDRRVADASYLIGLLDNEGYWNRSGSAQPFIKPSDVKGAWVPLPPLDEQRRIAEVLRSVDEAITAATSALNTSEKLLHSARHHAFSADKKSVAFASVITLISGQHVDTAQCNKEGLGVPYLTGPSDFPDGEIIVTKFTATPTVMCQPGDILITVKGSGVGKAVIANTSYCISRQLMAIRSKTLPAAFLFEGLQMVVEELNAEASGPIPGITRDHILVKRIPAMDTAVQEYLAATFSSVRYQIRLTKEQLCGLNSLKGALMSDLLAGRVRVPA